MEARRRGERNSKKGRPFDERENVWKASSPGKSEKSLGRLEDARSMSGKR